MMNRLSRALASSRFPWAATALAFVLCLPALDAGFFLDDYFHRAALLHPPELPDIHRSPADLFAFYGPHWELGETFRPWWVDDELRLAFWRPITGLTHLFDVSVRPGDARFMHLHSLLWFAAAVLFAGLSMRRILGPDGVGGTFGGGASVAAWTGGLAMLLFAVDDAHSLPVAWIANRNALIAGAFGFAALFAHMTGRRRLAPLLLALSVLGGETGVACGAYLLAYALFLEEGAGENGTLVRRLRTIAPCAGVGVIWSIAYHLQGYGAGGSGVYVDPIAQPLRFLGVLAERAPILVSGQFLFPPADLYLLLSVDIRVRVIAVAWLLVAVLAAFFGSLLYRDRRARFFACGAALSLIPACATFPSNRLLIFVGFGAAGLLALATERAFQRSGGLFVGLLQKAVLAVLLLCNLVVSPLFLVRSMSDLPYVSTIYERPAHEIEVRDGEVLIFLSGPSVAAPGSLELYSLAVGRPLPRVVSILATSLYEIELRRIDERTLSLRPLGGFLLPPGSAPEGLEPRAFDIRYSLSFFDTLFRDPRDSFAVGDRFEAYEATIEVTELTADGRAAEIVVSYSEVLEDLPVRWLAWRDGGYHDVALPAPGATLLLPAPELDLSVASR